MSLFTNDTVSPPRRRSRRNSGRVYAVGAVMMIVMIAVAVRLFVLQIRRHEGYTEQARKQYESRVALQAERGAIYDRNGNLLVSTIPGASFAADPNTVENAGRIASAFSHTLGGSYQEYFKKVTSKNTSFVWLRRKLSGTPADSLSALQDNGLITIREPLRRAEYGIIGAQVIGCTDLDNNGIGGVELYYNSLLKGADGFIVMQRDARGRRRPDVDLPQTKPENGMGLMLTIDITVQQIVEDELLAGVQQTGAASGTAVALDPRTGEILALVACPGYDPNNLRGVDPAAMRVRAITDMYEPGSTMKAITASAALQEGQVKPDETINCEGGSWNYGVHLIRDDHPEGVVTVRQAFEQSSNIAFAKIASRLPAGTFYKYVRDFGFGIVTGIDLPGEVNGEVKHPGQFSGATQQYMAFGYQLAVTPLQLVCAYATIANGGVMMRPHLLKRRFDRDGAVLEDVQPVQMRRVVSPQTAATVRDMLVGVVERGTGLQARLDGLSIAGKTGTTQQLTDGAYSDKKHTASFVGFFPADNPKIALLVLLDAPTNGYYGGQVAAPIFRRIARRIAGIGLQTMDPQLAAAAHTGRDTTAATPRPNGLAVPDLRGVDPAAARQIAARFGFHTASNGGGGVVLSQQPPAGTVSDPQRIITLGTVSPSRSFAMPDVRGLTLRRALNMFNAYGIVPRAMGQGVVRSQQPAPGTGASGGTAVMLECDAGEIPVRRVLHTARDN